MFCLFASLNVRAHRDVYSHIVGDTRNKDVVLYPGHSREAMVNLSITQLEVTLKIACGDFSWLKNNNQCLCLISAISMCVQLSSVLLWPMVIKSEGNKQQEGAGLFFSRD